jgi:hypothetical protein
MLDRSSHPPSMGFMMWRNLSQLFSLISRRKSRQAITNHKSPEAQRFYYQDYLTEGSCEAQNMEDHDETANLNVHLHPQTNNQEAHV